MPPACRGSEAPPGTRGKIWSQRCLYPVAYLPIHLPRPRLPPRAPPPPLPSSDAASYPSCLSGWEHSVFSSLRSVYTLMGATKGEHDSQAPSPGLYTPLLLLQGGKKGLGAKLHQASSNKRGWLIWTDSLEILPPPPTHPPTSHGPHLSSTLLRGAGGQRDAGSKQTAPLPAFSVEALRTESNMHFQQLLGRGFPGEARLARSPLLTTSWTGALVSLPNKAHVA